MKNELSSVCCEQNPNPRDRRRRLIKLLKSGAGIHAIDKNGVTTLHHKVRFRSPTAIKTLIEHGANVNQVCWNSAIRGKVASKIPTVLDGKHSTGSL